MGDYHDDRDEIRGVALDAHDPQRAAAELFAALMERQMDEMQRIYLDGNPSPEGLATFIAHQMAVVVESAFHAGRAWQSAHDQHERIHELEHGEHGGALN